MLLHITPVLNMMDLTNQLLIKNPIFAGCPTADKIDIYDFGVILLEVVTGRPITSIRPSAGSSSMTPSLLCRALEALPSSSVRWSEMSASCRAACCPGAGGFGFPSARAHPAARVARRPPRARAQRATPACVWEGVFYKCALNLRLNKYVWTAVNHLKVYGSKKPF